MRFRVRKPSAIQKIKIEAPIIVAVEETCARTHRLDLILRRGVIGVVLKMNTGRLADIDEFPRNRF